MAEIITGIEYPENTYKISPIGGDYQTIQAALDAHPTAGALFEVYPGTYVNDTINLTANNQMVKGVGTSPKGVFITNTAQIVDSGATTGGTIENVKMVMTVPADSIDVTVTGTGSLNCKFCHVEAVISGTNGDANGASCYSGTGDFKIVEGSIVYTDTSDRGTKEKKAVNVEGGSSWIIDDVTMTVTGSGTSSSMSAVRDVSDGTAIIDKSTVNVTDNESDATYGFSTVNGNGDGEYLYNTFHIINNGAGNVAAGGYFDSDDSSLSIRSSYNHVHAESSAGTANSIIINDATTTVVSQFDDFIAADGVSNSGGTLTMLSSEADGELTVTGEVTGDLTGNADTVTTITGLAPDTQNTYARTQYLIPVASSTTAMGEIAIGAATEVLTSNGAGAAPTFQAPAAGGDVSKSGNLVNNSLVIGAGASSVKDLPMTAQSIPIALTANSMSSMAVTEQTIVGRKTGGNVDNLSATEVKTILALENVENTALSTGQAGTVATITGLAPDTATTQATQASITSAANLTTVGTIGTGVWEGTDVAVLHGGTGASDAAGAKTNLGFMTDLSDDTTPTLGGELDAGAHSIGFTLQTATGDGTTTMDFKLGNKFEFTFGAQNETFTFTAPTKPGNFLLTLIQDDVGGRTVTWPATVKWPASTAPTLTTDADAVDIVSMYWNGTNWFASSSLAFGVPA